MTWGRVAPHLLDRTERCGESVSVGGGGRGTSVRGVSVQCVACRCGGEGMPATAGHVQHGLPRGDGRRRADAKAHSSVDLRSHETEADVV